MLREQNEIALVALAETLTVKVVDRDVAIVSPEQRVDPYQSYLDKGGKFNRETFYNIMFDLDEFMFGDARAKTARLFSNTLQNQVAGLARRENTVLSKEQIWLYCFLRDNQGRISQEERGEAGKNPLYWSDHVIFAEVLKLPSLAEWKLVKTLPNLREAA